VNWVRLAKNGCSGHGQGFGLAIMGLSMVAVMEEYPRGGM